MEKIFSLYERLSFKYNDGWKEEDEYRYIGQATQLWESDPNYSDDGDQYQLDIGVRIDEVEPGTNVAQIENAICNEYVFSCTCEHDCCGHYFGGVRNLVRTNNDPLTYRVGLHALRNV